jgi:hypothetical protein
MGKRSLAGPGVWGLVGAAILALAPIGVAAQSPNDFLLGMPRGSVSFRGGYTLPSEGSEVFAFTRRHLTINDGDFASFMVGADLAYRLNERLDLNFSLEHSQRSRQSESRDFIGTDDLPIFQSTRLSRTPFTVGLRAYLKDRGRSLSQFVWIPNQWTPYVGVGLGTMRYEFEQSGEFVDFQTFDIFRDVLVSGGSSFTMNLLAGADVPVGPRFGVVGELKYSWAKAAMDPDFVGFDEIDLSGTQAVIGLLVRF